MITEMIRKAGTIMDDHVPDVAKLFTSHLKMNMRESGVEARISKYSMDFDRLTDEHRISTWVIRGSANDVTGRQRMKMRATSC